MRLTACRRIVASLGFLVVTAGSAGATAAPGDGLSGYLGGAIATLDHEPVRSRLEAVNGELECNVIDFEGTASRTPIGLVEGAIAVDFGSSWLALEDADFTGNFELDGNFANEPSQHTVAYFAAGADPISFATGVQFVELFYTARGDSVPVTLRAWSGPNGTGTVIDQVVGDTIGSSIDGAECSGDPNGVFCLWSTLTLTSEQNNIRSVTISGAAANAFAFDDMTFCNAPPVVLETGPEEGFVPATVRPEAPRVIFGPDGGKAVVWFQQGNGGTIICVQFFDAEGRALTEPLLVNEIPGDNRTPTAAFDDQGRLHILWSREEGDFAYHHGDRLGLAAAQGSTVVGRSFDKNGQPQSGETTVTSGATGESAQPETDSDLTGNSVVVWLDGGKVRARLLDANGNPRSPTFDVNTGNLGSDPALAVSAFGDFAVVWQGVSGGGPAIFVRRYTDDGAPKANGEVVSTAGSPAHAAVAIDDAGNFVVAWDAEGASGRDIFTQRYAANGTKRGGIRQANANASGDQTNPRVDVNSKGRFAVVWESTEGAPSNAASIQGQSVLGRVFSPQGEPERAETEIATTDAGTTPQKPDVSLSDDEDMAVVYERRGPGGQSQGIFRKDVAILAPPGECVADDNTLCLSGGRFRVTALWEEPSTRVVSQARAETLTGDTGFFWFFNPDNVEVVVKALGACPVNSRFWVFAAGLTNVEVTLRVDDVITGQSNTYFNDRGAAYLPILDTEAFATCNAASVPAGAALTEREVAEIRDDVLAGLLTLVGGEGPRLPDAAAPDAVALPTEASAAACATDSDSLCVTANRFRVEVDFRTPGGQAGNGQAIKLTNDTGYFWFFDPDNVEIVIKVLNACSIGPGRFWVFAAGLTNVEAEITVVDTNTGARRQYENSLGTAFVPIQDTNAFATCP